MDKTAPAKLKDVVFNREKFDAVLRRMIASKPMPLKDVVGTSPRSPKRRKAVQISD